MDSIWDILQIKKTSDVKKIKRAYASLLNQYHPEEDPQGFIVLRQAYEAALLLTRKDTRSQKGSSTKVPLLDTQSDQIQTPLACELKFQGNSKDGFEKHEGLRSSLEQFVGGTGLEDDGLEVKQFECLKLEYENLEGLLGNVLSCRESFSEVDKKSSNYKLNKKVELLLDRLTGCRKLNEGAEASDVDAVIEWKLERDILLERYGRSILSQLSTQADDSLTPGVTVGHELSQRLETMLNTSEIRTRDHESNDERMLALDDMYENIVGQFEALSLNAEDISGFDKWEEILSDPIVNNYRYKKKFSLHVLRSIITSLRVSGWVNGFTPKVILLIINYVESVCQGDEHSEITDDVMLILVQLKKSTCQYIEDSSFPERMTNKSLLSPRWVLFSFKGRLQRIDFIISFTLLCFAFYMTMVIHSWSLNGYIEGGLQYVEMANAKLYVDYILYSIFTWVLLALVIKRMNDTGLPASYLMFVFVPLIGALALIIILVIIKDRYDNEHGQRYVEIKNIRQYQIMVYKTLSIVRL